MFWLWIISGLVAPAQAGVPLVVNVDKGLEAVTIRCPNGIEETQKVANGQVSFDMLVEGCSIAVTKTIGSVKSNGTWTCTERGCSLDVPPHAPVTNADGRVNLIFLDSGKASTIELSCSGYRQRTKIADHTAIFEGAPKGDCTVYAKGGTTAKSQPVQWGTYVCTIAGPTLVCQNYKP